MTLALARTLLLLSLATPVLACGTQQHAGACSLDGAPSAALDAAQAPLLEREQLLSPTSWFRASTALSALSAVGATDSLWLPSAGSAQWVGRLHGPRWQERCFEAGGAPSVHFFGALSAQYLDTASPDCFRYLHEPTGMTLVMMFVAKGSNTRQTLLSSYGRDSRAGAGMLLEYDPGYEAVAVAWSAGGREVGRGRSTDQSVPLGFAALVSVRTAPVAQQWSIRINGRDNATGGWRGASVGDSAYPLRMGALVPDLSGAFSGEVLELVSYARTLTDQELTQVEAIVRQRYTADPLEATTAPLAVPPLEGTVKILPLGDSITQGLTGATERLGGWRQRVDELRASLPFAIDFVGTQELGHFADNQHEGHSGWVIDNRIAPTRLSGASAGSTNAGNVSDILQNIDPQVVVVMLGINTLNAGGDDVVLARDALNDYFQLILDIHQRRPAARVVIAPPCRTSGAGIRESRRVAFNAGLGAVVRALSERGVIVAVADTATVLEDSDLADGLHPNDHGNAKLGDSIARAIRYVAGHP